MTIRYSNGHTAEALLLARTETSLRVQIREDDDATEFRQLNGTWISDDCEPVHIDFGQVSPTGPVVTLDDRICSPAEASLLLDLFFSGELEPEAVHNFAVQRAAIPVYRHIM